MSKLLFSRKKPKFEIYLPKLAEIREPPKNVLFFSGMATKREGDKGLANKKKRIFLKLY